MPREARLRSKNGHWYTAAHGGRYFGRKDVVPYTEAKRVFFDFLNASQTPTAFKSLSIATFCKEFVQWVKKNRSERTLDERRRHLEFFCNFRIGDTRLGDLAATDITGVDLERMIESLTRGSHDRAAVNAFTADKYATSVKAAFNWGRKHPSPTSLLPVDFTPFSSVEKFKRPVQTMFEWKLPTPEEVEAILHFADADLDPYLVDGKWRRREAIEYRTGEENSYRGFADMIRVYYGTGARTSELAAANVGDFDQRSNVIILGEHKRLRKMKQTESRRITLNNETAGIVRRLCERRERHEPIFISPQGRRWTRLTLANRFSHVRERASVRKEITIYSFRHLWITEALQASIPVASIAKMAGTSIQMIEKVYGHSQHDHEREAQAKLDAERSRKQIVRKATGTTTAA